MDFPDSFFFFSLFFFFFPGVRLRSSGTEFIMVTDSGPHNYSVFFFFVFGARTPLRSMSRASTAARHRGPRAAHPTHSAALGSSVQKSCFFFRDVRNGLTLHRPIFPGGHRICPPSFCTRKRSALRTNPKAKAKRVSTVLPVSAEHDERRLFFPLRALELTADVNALRSLFRSLPRPSHHRTTPAYGVARNRVPARLNSIFGNLDASQGSPPRSSLEC